jgi:branched-subunit amino acid aminotransferase/4-amino-4-deoxychorismate lyase
MFPFVWLNGAILPHAAATISPLTEGFLYGIGAFETMRWHHERGIFRLNAHLERLSRTLDVLGVRWNDMASVSEALRVVVEANAPTRDVVVRLTVAANLPEEPLCLMALRDVSYSETVYERGFVGMVHPTPRVTELARHKSLNYAECWMARQAALRQGYDEALFCDADGYLLEGATTNLFLVREDVLYTPSGNRPFLKGITRSVVLERAQEWGIPAVETDVRREELSDASEAFLTNSVAGILPLTRIGDRPIGFGSVGRWTATLWKAYRELCRRELDPMR